MLPKNITQDRPWLNEEAILACYRGSITHGTYRPSSEPNSIDDKDVLTVCVPSIDHYFGLKQFGSRGTKELAQGEWDIVTYEARKYIGLLAKGNPNVLGSLWLEPQYYIKTTPAFDLILENRHLFVGKWVYRSFLGYAHSQLSRMERYEHYGYMGRKRKALVEEFGFDCKNASHLIRLLRMGIEFLTEGRLFVERHDAQELLDIKNGHWSLECVKQTADALFDLAHQAYINSALPTKQDYLAINKLCVDVIAEAMKERE